MRRVIGKIFANEVVSALEQLDGGVLCRLDDNRALAILLANEAPHVLLSHPEIYDWLKANERFFSTLSNSKVFNKKANRLRKNRNTPRNFDFDEMSKFFNPRFK